MAFKIDARTKKFREYLDWLSEQPDEVILAAAVKSPAVHFALFCRIKDDNNNVIDPSPNTLQLQISEAYETLKDLGVRVRIIITKPRRAGCSSFVEHIGYHSAMVSPIEGITISDSKEHSADALKKLQSYAIYDSFPWGIEQMRDAAHSISWSNGSKWTVDTAMNPDAGAGGTYQYAHCSETSKWPQTTTLNDFRTMSCLIPAVSGMNTVMFSESTPEGAKGWQYETWKDAITLPDFLEQWEKGYRPEEVWIRVFAAWFEFESNRRREPVTGAEIGYFQQTLSATEKEEIEKYDLDWEQIGWRRDTIKGKCGGDAKVFSYYFPSDPVSCWFASGAPRFDMAILSEMHTRAKNSHPENGSLNVQHQTKVSFVMHKDGSGDIQVWEHPQLTLSYIISCDPATDETQTVGADPDRHSVTVWRKGYHDTHLNSWRPAKMVARLRAPFYGDGDVVAAHIARLSFYYGKCMVGLEINMGLDILRLLKNSGVPLYKRRAMSHRTKESVEQFGFRMGDKQERNALIEGFAAALRNYEIEIPCVHFIEECQSFIVKADGRAEAAGKKHDDDVLGGCIAWEIMPNATEYRPDRFQNNDPPDRNGWRRTII